MVAATYVPPPRPHSDDEIIRRIVQCPKLGSLQTVNRALRALVNSERSLNSQIADVIRHDPSLSARLLRMVNSVFFGLSTRVNNIEEAVFFLGLRHIRELAVATPVIEELEQLATANLPWKEMWNHSIGAAMLTREILGATSLQIDDDTDYLIGLLHNVGTVVMAHAFPEELTKIVETSVRDSAHLARIEREVIGWDHAQIGAHYLARHQLSEEIVAAIRHQNEPEDAGPHQLLAAAVQVADSLVRHANIGRGFGHVDPIPADAWTDLPGWQILFGAKGTESGLARAAIANALERLPLKLKGLLSS